MSRTASRLVLLAASLAVAAPVGAQEFLRTQVPGEELCLWWKDRGYTYHLDAAGNADTPGTSEFTAIEAAFQTWVTLAASCSDYKFTKGPQVTQVVVGYDQGSTSNTNVLTFREKACRDVVPPTDPCIDDESCGNDYKCWDHSDTTIALTTTTFSFKTGIIFDADIEMNAAPHSDGARFLFTSVASPPCEAGVESVTCVATDIQNTLTHEIGHVVGLDHVDVPGSTMEPSAPIGETQKRILDSGTSAGFCTTYPSGKPTPSCDPTGRLTRRVRITNLGTAGCSAAGAPVSLALVALALLWVRVGRKVAR